MTREEVIQEIQRVAAEENLPPWRLRRSVFVRKSPVGWKYEAHGNWNELRESAAGKPYAPAEKQDPPIDPVVPRYHNVAGVSTLVGPDGETRIQWIKTRAKERSREEVLAEMLAEVPKLVSDFAEPVTEPYPNAPEMLAVYPMGDPHIGMRAWAEETQGEDFDLPIAIETTKTAIDALVTQGPRADQALIVNLGDYFHADNFEGRTARSGHSLDVDSRWPKVLLAGLELMVYIIQRALEHHREVRVINEIGNHDDHTAIMLSVYLSAYYRNEPRVQIDLSPSRFHYHKFGRNLFGVTHGHSVKHESLESIMAHDQPEWWGETDHRYWFIGHVHHSKRQDYRGCVVETFRTLAPVDAWAAEAGYRSKRDMNRISFHETFGEVERSTVNAAYLKARYSKRL